MNKTEFLKAVQETVDFEVTQKDLATIFDAQAKVVVNTLKNDKDEKITIPNLGTFKVKDVPERRGVAALVGNKEWVKPAHSEITFKITKSIKEI